MSIDTSTSPRRVALERHAGAGTWRTGLPVFADSAFTLRELHLDDASSLVAHLATEEVARFVAPPPSSIAGFEAFIEDSQRGREAGHSVCFAVAPAGASRAVGLFQLRSLTAGFANAEWGFAIGSAYWGTGLFAASAAIVLDFAFDTIGVERLEARAVVVNGRGNGALRKIGAVQEGLLRRSFLKGGQSFDQVMWSMLAEDWRRKRNLHRTRVH